MMAYILVTHRLHIPFNMYCKHASLTLHNFGLHSHYRIGVTGNKSMFGFPLLIAVHFILSG
jgi:hypothetical protein